jgi:hypothetical protein
VEAASDVASGLTVQSWSAAGTWDGADQRDDEGVNPTDRRQALWTLGGGVLGVAASAAIGPPAAEAMECTRRAEASEVGARALEHLQLAITDMASAFASTPPAELLPRA